MNNVNLENLPFLYLLNMKRIFLSSHLSAKIKKAIMNKNSVTVLFQKFRTFRVHLRVRNLNT